MAEDRYIVHVELTTAAQEHTARALLDAWSRNVFVAKGRIEATQDAPERDPCSWCGGSGFVATVPCRECKGTGRELPETEVQKRVAKLLRSDAQRLDPLGAQRTEALIFSQAELRLLLDAVQAVMHADDERRKGNAPRFNDATVRIYAGLSARLHAGHAVAAMLEATPDPELREIEAHERLEDLERQEKESPNTVDLYFCASPNCPGYVYRASETPHPHSTCGSNRKAEYDRRD